MRKIGILNGGGDCPGANAVVHGIISSLPKDVQAYGYYKSFEGVLHGEKIELTESFTYERRLHGGIYLKSVNKGVFSARVGLGELKVYPEELVSDFKKAYDREGLEGLILIGGDGTFAGAHQMMAAGIRFIGIPKSIDNDLNGTDVTFGFATAVDRASEALECLRTTGASHDRHMILEVMGRSSGSIALHAGLNGLADIILLPEIEFSYKHVREKIEEIAREKNRPSVIVIAEGASLKVNHHHKETTNDEEIHMVGAGNWLLKKLQADGLDARLTVLGHIARGGQPSHHDLGLSHLYGAKAAELVRKNQWNELVAKKGESITSLPLTSDILKVRQVQPDDNIIHLLRLSGTSFGDKE